jgi:ParB family chromosome partitioning protein
MDVGNIGRTRNGVVHEAGELPAQIEPELTQTMQAAATSETPAAPAIFTEAQDAVPPEAPTSTLPRQGTGDAERYTPKEWIERVRAVLGTIDVDPASCAIAQATVQATTFYTLYDNGLHHSWPGTVFLNPPYGWPEVEHFCGKLVEEWDAGRTTAAIILVNSATETAWFQLLAQRAAVVCFPRKRIAFGHPTRTDSQPPQGQPFFYFGQDPRRFCEVFGETGTLLHLVGRPVNAELEDPRGAAEWVIETHGEAYAGELAETIQGILAPTPTPHAPAALSDTPATGTLGEQIVEVLRAEPSGLTDVHLAKVLDIRPVNARFAISRLIKEGLVRQIGTTSTYRLVEPKEAP